MHPLVLFRSAYVVILVIMAFVSTLIFTDEIKAKFQPLEPAFENLLRSSNVHEDVINALRMEEILDREMFISFYSTEEGLARFISSMPGTIEELRNKYQVMTHMLLAQMRQPTRPIYSDLQESTFTKLLDELLSEKNFLLEREIAGCKMVVPEWAHCLEYEFQIRKEALRLVREEGQSIEKAYGAAYQNPHQRVEHWLTLLSIANSGVTKSSSSSSSSNPADQRLQKIERKFAELERSLQRSRSPRMKFSAIAAPQTQLALPAPPKGQGKRSKGKNGKGKGKANQGQHFPQRLIRSLRTRSTTDSSFTRRPTRRVFATIFKRGNAQQILALFLEIMCAWDAANPMFSASLVAALTMWWSSEQSHALSISSGTFFACRSCRAASTSEVNRTSMPCTSCRGRLVSRD